MRRYAPLAAGVAFLICATTGFAYIFNQAKISDALDPAHAWIKGHLNRPEGFFFLGGIEGAAWARGRDAEISVGNFGDADFPPRFVPWLSIMFERSPTFPVTLESQNDLRASIVAYREAVGLDAKNALYQLALGWATEEAAKAIIKPFDGNDEKPADLTGEEKQQCQRWIGLLKIGDPAQRQQAAKNLEPLLPRDTDILLAAKSADRAITEEIDSVLRSFWLHEAVDHYRQAYRISLPKDLKADSFDSEADATVSVKAGERLLPLLPMQPDAKPAEIEDIRKSIQTIRSKPTMAQSYN
jgi:hypothetical protein